MASLTNNATADNTAPILTLAELDAHIAEFERMSALFGPGGWLFRAIAPAEATEVVELTSGDLDDYAAGRTYPADRVISDEEWDAFHEAGRDERLWL